VVLIHGIGAIKRNTTLVEAVNTLAYWFNHEAGLALRREGDGRLWLTAQLTDDPNPDAPAARAAMNLVAPDGSAITPESDAGLRLEFREVWWAESFGLPSVAETIRWAQVQFREQATHLLVPIGRRLGPAQTAAHTPAHEIPQALTYRPLLDNADASRAGADGGISAADSAHTPLTRTQRRLLTATLWLYGLVQYVWKALQWLILTPLLFLSLLLMGPLRLLALIPPLRSTVIAGLSAVLEYIMLHWIAETQVYALDYTRSAGIRERFEREVNAFLRDERCDRIVVIAHSLGTVIAYEGLTNTLTPADQWEMAKPVTFICLAQALRRVWLVAADDPHRLHGVLPEWVRWLHFWARYDPVAAGPLSPGSLPSLEHGSNPTVPDPYAALRARLARCENVDVVNTDSTFTDHTTYWQNLEQVIGPIASELVTGHPGLERIVGKCLATPDEILWRRWRVAWRSTLAIASGLAAGIGFFLWDWQVNLFHDPTIPHPETSIEGGPLRPFGVGHALGNSFVPSFVQSVSDSLNTGPLGFVLRAIGGGFDTIYTAFKSNFSSHSQGGLTLPSSLPDALYSAGTALVLTGVLIVAIGNFVAIPSPAAFRRTVAANQQSARSIVALATMCLTLLAGASLTYMSIVFTISFSSKLWVFNLSLYGGLPNASSPLFGLQPADYVPEFLRYDVVVQGLLYLGLLVGTGAVVLALFDAGRSRRWGVYLPQVLLFVVLLLEQFRLLPPRLYFAFTHTLGFDFGGGRTSPLFYSGGVLSFIISDVAGIALLGCILVLAETARSRRWGWFATILLTALFLVASLDLPIATFYDGVVQIPGVREVVGTYSAFATTLQYGGLLYWASPALVALIYGLWSYRRGTVMPSDDQAWRASVALGLATVAVVGLMTASVLSSDAFNGVLDAKSLQSAGGVILIGIGVVSACVLGVFLWDIVRGHRWGWLVAVTGAGILVLLYSTFSVVTGHRTWQGIIVNELLAFMLPSAIAYALWARSSKSSALRKTS
jgi:hypothetical protein